VTIPRGLLLQIALIVRQSWISVWMGACSVVIMKSSLNPSLERTRTSRSRHGRLVCHGRLVRAAHAGR